MNFDTCSTGMVTQTCQYPYGVVGGSNLDLADYQPVAQAKETWIIVCQYCGTEWSEALCPGCGGNARIKIKVDKEESD